MIKHHCKYCSTISNNLKIEKLFPYIEKIKEFQKVVDDHNKNTNNELIKDDKKWEIVRCMSYIVIRKEGDKKGWLYSYKIPFIYKECYVTCSNCKDRYIFKYKEN